MTVVGTGPDGETLVYNCGDYKPWPRAVYAGSFDPITTGHLDIIKRTVALFGGCSVLAAVNAEKSYMFTSDEKLALIARSVIENAPAIRTKVALFNTSEYVADWCAREIGKDAVLVRGIRDASDLPAELAIARFNKERGLDTVILPADPELSKVSSSALKQLVAAALKGVTEYSPDSRQMLPRSLLKYAPPAVLLALHTKTLKPKARIL